MLQNYLLIAWRNLNKHKFIFGINLFGLTIGLTCSLLILIYILHELSYDKYHQKAENIYRVERTFINPETKEKNLELGSLAPPFGPLLENDFKEIKNITRLLSNGVTSFKYGENIFNEQNAFFADENIFKVFDIQVVKGNPENALSEPYSVMLTEEVAAKYFGNNDPLNETVRLDNLMDCKITGVYKAFPSNSHMHPGMLISFTTLRDSAIYGEEQLRTNWGNNSFRTYIELPENYNPKNLEAQFPAFQNRHIREGNDGKFKPSDWSKLTLKKLTDIHLHSKTDDEIEPNGDIKRIYIFSSIVLFILLIACINYMNLATARSVLRAKEIGIRKVIGARRPELIKQFLSESIMLTWFATILAFFLLWLALPWLNKLSGQTLYIESLLNWKVLLSLLLMPFVVGSLAGFYPAMFLSGFQPIRVLKGLQKMGGANISFRQVLVVTQFAVSIVLIIATIIAFQQLKFLHEKFLGYDKDHVVNCLYTSALRDSYQSFKNELLSNSNIEAVTRSSRIPTGRLLDASGSQINLGDTMAPTKADIKFLVADHDFLQTYGIQIVEGRDFSQQYGTDTSSYLLNEAAVRVLGIKSNKDVVGKPFIYGGNEGKIIGVFNDFHFESLHQRILPMVIMMPPRWGFSSISIKVSGDNIPGALAHIENIWNKFLPEVPFEYTFLDSQYEKLYESEQRQKTIFTVFACIAILIACLGLLGLSAFSISQRVKEIGIRKVLGADVKSIVGLLSKDFLKLVIIAAVIAFPVAWYFMSNWLNDFAYRINIPLWVFLFAGIVATVVAFATISIQAMKAATANPVKNLRTE